MISEEQESEGGLLRKEDKAEHSKWEKILPHTVQMHLFLTSDKVEGDGGIEGERWK